MGGGRGSKHAKEATTAAALCSRQCVRVCACGCARASWADMRGGESRVLTGTVLYVLLCVRLPSQAMYVSTYLQQRTYMDGQVAMPAVSRPC